MKRKLTAGLTGVTLPLFVQDTTSTTGGGLAGLTHASGGLVAEYRRQGQSAWTTITLAAGTLGTWSDGGFVADGALAGAYELGVPDAAVATGARWVVLRLRGAANMLPVLVEIELDVLNYQIAGVSSILFASGVNAINANIDANQALIEAAQTDLTVLGARLTTDRAGRLDSLPVSGLVATQADVQSITQAQKVRVVVPQVIERPDAGTLAYRIWIYAYNETHAAEDLDANPTVAAQNNIGTDRSVNLSAVTKPGGTTGQYYVDYTVSSVHAVEGLLFLVDAVEGGITTRYVQASIVVDTTAVDFTAQDRSDLQTLLGRVTGPTALEATLTAMKGVGWTAETLVTLQSAINSKPSAVAIRAEMDANSIDLNAIIASLATLSASIATLPPSMLDTENVETGVSVRSALKLILAAAAGLVNGAEGTEVTLQNPAGDKNRIVATTDQYGNRTAVTLDVS